MYSRIVQCNLKRNQLSDVRQALDTEVIPSLKQQPGFVDAIESCDPATGQFVCMTLWKTREDADRYGRDQFPRLAEKLLPFVDGEPTVQTLQVETSTVHDITASKAA